MLQIGRQVIVASRNAGKNQIRDCEATSVAIISRACVTSTSPLKAREDIVECALIVAEKSLMGAGPGYHSRGE